MSKTYKILILTVLILGFLGTAIWYLHSTNIAVLNPKGPIALQERRLIYIALALSLIVVVPVYTLTVAFAWHYRESNKKAKYSPNLSGNRTIEIMWWLVPSAIIFVLAIIAWNASHTLDPYRPIASSNHAPLTIQVVALDWKWLFIYPEQNIATVNYFQFPKDVPLDFEITSDSVMNSFWIPQLGGQIYAMPGMSTQLHLMATSYGSFNGSSANISGVGFAGMTFVAHSSSTADFTAWAQTVKNSSNQLSASEYNSLEQPSQNNPVSFYASVSGGLYDSIINKYMAAGSQQSGMNSNPTYPSAMSQGMAMP